MRPVFVKINLKSIKKNPDYKLYSPGSVKEIFSCDRIEFEVDGELPPFLIDEENCTITQWSLDSNKKKWYKGLLLNEDVMNGLFDYLLKNNQYKVNINRERDIITTSILFTPSEYIFTYRKTYTKCKKCKSKIEVNEIRHDSYDEEDYYIEFTVCPICKEHNSFSEITYQKIEDVIKS